MNECIEAVQELVDKTEEENRNSTPKKKARPVLTFDVVGRANNHVVRCYVQNLADIARKGGKNENAVYTRGHSRRKVPT